MSAIPLHRLSGASINLFYIAWLDLVGDPVFATTYPGGLTFAPGQTGDDDLDGKTFAHVPASLVDISPVTHQAGGADQVTATLSGLPGPDGDLLSLLRVQSNWQGRLGRLWHGVHDGAGGGMIISPYYTGYIVQAPLSGDPESGGRVAMQLENYLAVLSTARNRSYQDQQVYDPLDKVAARIRAAANGVKGTAIGGVG